MQLTSKIHEADDFVAVQELFHSHGWTDGLPIVPPTADAVSACLEWGMLAPDQLIGVEPVRDRPITAEKLAINAVMAGCLPMHFPVVVAAVTAMLQPEFLLHGATTSTGGCAILLVINGPIRLELNTSPTFNALGSSDRATMVIGRALRLILINVLDVKPGGIDRSTLGHPGKISYCLAEDEENSPFKPLHVDLGFAEEDSVVTVIGAEAPHSVIFSGDGDDPDSYKYLLNILAVGLANAATNNATLTSGSAVVVLNPDHANLLAASGLDRQLIAEELYNRCKIDTEELRRLVPNFAGGQEATGDRYAFTGPEQILILVAGGGGLYSMVMPSWCAGAHKNSPSSVVVESEFVCEVPGLAALTES